MQMLRAMVYNFVIIVFSLINIQLLFAGVVYRDKGILLLPHSFI